jgi:[acyl-carrier-protein] S-malonyltransferase
VAEICGRVGGIVQPANFNTPVQTVITGDKGSVTEAGKLAKAEGYKVIPLKVSGAWHSPLMAQAGQEMEEAIERVEFQPLVRHLVPNTSARPTRDAAEVKRQLKAQLTSSVRWVQSVEAMLEMGVEVFIEAGPKKVLAGLIKKTAPQAQVLGFEDPEGLEKVLAALPE